MSKAHLFVPVRGMAHSPPTPGMPAGIRQGLWRCGSWGPGGHGTVVQFWLLFCCSLLLHPTLTVHKRTKKHDRFLLSILSAPLQKFSYSNLTWFKHLICISFLKRLAASICSGVWRLHQGNEITFLPWSKREKSLRSTWWLTVSQYVDTKVKLDGGGRGKSDSFHC